MSGSVRVIMKNDLCDKFFEHSIGDRQQVSIAYETGFVYEKLNKKLDI